MTPEQWGASVDEHLGDSAQMDPPGSEGRPVVALVGAYDTGKTSLLRRLLTDEGKDIPGWARVSAREETSTVNEIDLFGCLLVDTPGLEGLSQWHGSATRASVLRADALLVLTTSNLFASGESETGNDLALDALDIVSGRAFAPNGLTYPPGSLAVVVNRFDEATPDPVDFPDDYLATRRRKLEELKALLKQRAPQTVAGSYRDAIACDPFGRTRNRIVPRSEYDKFRSWDGVAELTVWLKSLPEQISVLHLWRDVRVRAEALTERSKSLSRAVQEQRTQEAHARAGHAEAERLRVTCARERGAASARLSAAMDRALFSAPAPAGAHFRGELQHLLQAELGQWAEHVVQSLQKLAEEADTNLPDLAIIDAAKAAAALVAATGRPGRAQQAVHTTRKGVDLLKVALKTLTAADHGAQPSVKNAGGWIPNAWIKPDVAAGLEQMLGIAGELLRLAETETATRAADQENQRERLAREANRVATQMFTSQSAPRGWEGLFDQLIAGAEQSVTTWATLHGQATAGLAQAESASERNAQLLAATPQP